MVEQLKQGGASGGGELVLWYLHLLFTKQLDLYNNTQFANYHREQVRLYARYSDAPWLQSEAAGTPSVAQSGAAGGTGEGAGVGTEATGEEASTGTGTGRATGGSDESSSSLWTASSYENPLIRFLRWSNHVDLKTCLDECEKNHLDNEMCIILGMMGTLPPSFATAYVATCFTQFKYILLSALSR